MPDVVSAFQSPSVLSICTGLRGLELGVDHALRELWEHNHQNRLREGTLRRSDYRSVRTAAYVEIEAFIIENLVQQMEKGLLDAAPVFSDVKTFLRYAPYFREKIHGITAGYPCQPFSVAGHQKGIEDPRHLFPYISEIVDAIRPVWCFFENVRGHLGLGYAEVYRSLRGIGYEVEPGIFSASEIGATHQRERLFILAIRRDYLADDNGEWQQQLRGIFTEGWGWVGNGGEEELFSDTISIISETGPERSRWEEGTDIDRINAESNVGNSTPKHERTCAGQTGQIKFRRSSAESVEHSNIGRGEQCNEEEWKVRIADEGCEPMADSDSDGGSTGLSEQGEREEGHSGVTHHISNERRRRPKADAEKCGIQGHGAEGKQITGIQTGETISGRNSGRVQFPAPPGIYQHPWESPRTISGVGCRINGYNYREDLLRALGNAVCEWQAKKAFITLLGKFIKNSISK